jgi:hypothetical protein
VREVSGPDRFPLDELVQAELRAHDDTRRVLTDERARYFGVALDDHTLLPGDDALIFATRYPDWLANRVATAAR